MMVLFAWLVRGILLVILLAFIFPAELLFAIVFDSPLALALGLLALVVIALEFVLAVALHVLGNLLDVLIILGLIGIAWKWPRGMRGRFIDKLRVAIRSLRREVDYQLRRLTAADLLLLGLIGLLVLILSLSSGFLHFLLTVLVVLLIVGIVWKWPRGLRIRFLDKLRIALRALYHEIRRLI